MIKKIHFFIGIFFVLFLINFGSSEDIVWDGANTTFLIQSNNSVCTYDNQGDYYWNENGHLTPARDDCYREDAEDTNNCCPVGYDCQDSGEGPHVCVPYPEINFCSDYQNNVSCQNFSQGVADYHGNSVFGDNFCQLGHFVKTNDENCSEYVQRCLCEWDSANNTCVAAYIANVTCPNNPNPPVNPRPKASKCTAVNTQLTSCVDGKMKIVTNAYHTSSTSTGNILSCSSKADCDGYVYFGDTNFNCSQGRCISENCRPSEREIICPSEVLLKFVTPAIILLVIVFLIVFYVLSSRKKKVSKGTKKKRK
jgi:hypothetical protein